MRHRWFTPLLIAVAAAGYALAGRAVQAQDNVFPFKTGDTVTFTLELATRVPGVLEIKPKTSAVRRIWRTTFGSDTERTVEFAAEGVLEIPLDLPPPPDGQTRTIDEIRFTASLPKTRSITPGSSSRTLQIAASRATSRSTSLRLCDQYPAPKSLEDLLIRPSFAGPRHTRRRASIAGVRS